MLRFPYQPVPLRGPTPPSLAGAMVRWRPFVPVRIMGPSGNSRHFKRALVDPGSDDTIFPLAIANQIGISLRPDTGHVIRWGGQRYSLRFGDAELELSSNGAVWPWPAVVAFSDAPIQYRLLGCSMQW